jgi:uncharacterized protein (TIGR03435 family)
MKIGFMNLPTALVAGALQALCCYAQRAPHPEFEVASIKAIAPGQPNRLKVGAQIYGDRAEYNYMTLRQLVAEAYQVLPFQIVCPDWFLDRRFEVIAKMPAGSRKEDAPLMLQALLAERFRLSVHRESREEDVAALVVRQGGPKLTESPPQQPPKTGDTGSERPGADNGAAAKKRSAPSTSGTIGTVGVRTTLDSANSSVRFEANRVTMTDLARFLMNLGFSDGRPVVDMTGLKGEYEIALDIPISMVSGPGAPEASSANARAPNPADYASDPGGGRGMQSLRSYGLELKKMKAPLEKLVIDHAEKMPTEN